MKGRLPTSSFSQQTQLLLALRDALQQFSLKIPCALEVVGRVQKRCFCPWGVYKV